MNRLQKALLDILECFIKVCEEHQLTWFLVNGSALGAEKYGGFIPWDDDIDVAMPREDYEIFCQKAQNSLPPHLFLQNYKTQKEFPLFYSKLRNSNTTFIEEGMRHLDIHHGIYIDIFPLDNFPDGKLQQLALRCKLKVLGSLQFCGYKNNMGWRKRLLRAFGYHKKTDRTLARMEKLVRRYQNTKNVCDYGDRQGKGLCPRAFYEQCGFASFEGLQVPVPSPIEEYLSYKYGNWRAELPKEQQISHHYTVAYNLDVPYGEHIKSTDMLADLSANINKP